MRGGVIAERFCIKALAAMRVLDAISYIFCSLR